eukprot:403365383
MSQGPQPGLIDQALKVFDLTFDDIVVEEGENWVEKYYIKQIKKCNLKMPDGYTADMKSLAKDAPPDYSWMDAQGFKYYFNVCRNTIMTCGGRDDGIAIQYAPNGKCTALLGKIPMYSDYLDQQDRHKGFSVTYGGGDFCDDNWMERKVKFDFHCDPQIDFEVRYMDKSKPCEYTFTINTKQACDFIAPSGHLISGSKGLMHGIFQFYYGIFLFILSIVYYLLVGFVIYCIYKAIALSLDKSNNQYAKTIPFKERIQYYFYRLKSMFIA